MTAICYSKSSKCFTTQFIECHDNIHVKTLYDLTWLNLILSIKDIATSTICCSYGSYVLQFACLTSLPCLIVVWVYGLFLTILYKTLFSILRCILFHYYKWEKRKGWVGGKLWRFCTIINPIAIFYTLMGNF
jgi:hypothetical protein